ncbi:T-complex protein 1 subunit delta [Neonectria ditissima]|uniref:T-complex protein 1 subunit delta n=1 Tax=Neonectria ditissima TaxID=78410 RepID=A0A0P7AWR8_9HYPO|nr:T-complex protein 1 subunit delta [Neonectria ditissima]
MSAGAAPTALSSSNATFRDKEKPMAVRSSNIVAARAVADAIRTSLGPRGMDKMIRSGKGETIITNDGNTMLKSMSVMHPTAKMLVNLSGAQDVEAGDGTTSVVVICGSLLGAADRLLSKGIHPSVISESFQRAAAAAVEVLHDMSQPISLTDTASLLQAANTSLSSKIVSQYSNLLGPMAVNSVTKTIDLKTAENVDLNNIRIVKRVGGTIEDSELIDGLVLTQPVLKNAGGPVRMEKAKIGLIQFQLSPPKPDMENTIQVNDYRQMDKIVKEERLYLLNMAKKIKKAKCNVLFIQKSILRDAVNDLSLHFLSKLGILTVKEIERDEVEFICKSTGCKPIADIDSFTEDKLGSADLVEEVQSSGSRMIKVTGTKSAGKTVSVVVRGANSLILEEAERSLHDALCVVRCLVKKKALIAGGGAPEIEIAAQLSKQARSLTGTEAICYKAFADAMEVIPTTLAENAGLNSIKVVTDLRHRHEMGEKNAGVSIKSGGVNTNISKENVLQPLLVSTMPTALLFASEQYFRIAQARKTVGCASNALSRFRLDRSRMSSHSPADAESVYTSANDDSDPSAIAMQIQQRILQLKRDRDERVNAVLRESGVAIDKLRSRVVAYQTEQRNKEAKSRAAHVKTMIDATERRESIEVKMADLVSKVNSSTQELEAMMMKGYLGREEEVKRAKAQKIS